jgi:alkyldihydroxyacetonephosphate synthase
VRRKFWGWGLEGEGLAADELQQLGAVFAERLGVDGVRVQEPPRDHRPWYLREMPHLFTDALRGAKAGLDPAGIMNPGVLLEPTGAVTYSREGGRS